MLRVVSGVHDKTLKESVSGNHPHCNEIFCLQTVASGYTIFSFEYSVGWAENILLCDTARPVETEQSVSLLHEPWVKLCTYSSLPQ